MTKLILVGLFMIGSLSAFSETRENNFWVAFHYKEPIQLEIMTNDPVRNPQKVTIQFDSDAPLKEVNAAMILIQRYGNKIVFEDDGSVLPNRVLMP